MLRNSSELHVDRLETLLARRVERRAFALERLEGLLQEAGAGRVEPALLIASCAAMARDRAAITRRWTSAAISAGTCAPPQRGSSASGTTQLHGLASARQAAHVDPVRQATEAPAGPGRLGRKPRARRHAGSHRHHSRIGSQTRGTLSTARHESVIIRKCRVGVEDLSPTWAWTLHTTLMATATRECFQIPFGVMTPGFGFRGRGARTPEYSLYFRFV